MGAKKSKLLALEEVNKNDVITERDNEKVIVSSKRTCACIHLNLTPKKRKKDVTYIVDYTSQNKINVRSLNGIETCINYFPFQIFFYQHHHFC